MSFATADTILLVASSVLGETVIFASDNVRADRLAGRPEVVYRARELEILAANPPTAAGLRTAHAVKAELGGEIRESR